MPSNTCNNCGTVCRNREDDPYCPICGAVISDVFSDKEKKLLSEAFSVLNESRFDEAKHAFESVIRKYPENAEAYWGRFRARYHIDYVTAADGKLFPKCPTRSGANVFEDIDYRKATEYASEAQKDFLQAQANYIKIACSSSGASKNLVNRFAFGDVDPNDELKVKPKQTVVKPKKSPVEPKKLPIERLLSKKMKIFYAVLAVLISVVIGCWSGIIPMYNRDGFQLRSNGNGTFDVVGIGFCKDTEIEIPSRYLGMPVTGIGSEAFEYCDDLTRVYIPDGVTEIADFAFYCCSSLTSIDIPDGVTRIGKLAFFECIGLTSLDIPEGVTSIDSFAFQKCTGLLSVKFPSTLTSMGEAIFEDCTGLRNISVHENNAVYCSQDGVLFNKEKTDLLHYPINKADRSYAIPDGVTYVSSKGFRYRNHLQEIVIPDGMTGISYLMFQGCENLTSVEIPDSIEWIASGAFSDCTNLMTIRFGGTVEQWRALHMDPDWDENTGFYTVTCTDGSVSKKIT